MGEGNSFLFMTQVLCRVAALDRKLRCGGVNAESPSLHLGFAL
jgi:hypothetical protein